MTPAELRIQAQKYRDVVGMLAPNAPGRDYYLSRAEELERQVRVVTTDTSNDSPPPKVYKKAKLTKGHSKSLRGVWHFTEPFVKDNLTPEEHKALAEIYMQQAAKEPTVQWLKVRKNATREQWQNYWESRARYHESGLEPAAAAEPHQPEPGLSRKTQTRIHANLAMVVLADKRSGIHRAFVVWLILRQQNRRWFTIPEVIEFFAEQTGIHPRNIKRWIDSGVGIFWVMGRRNRLSILGKNRVFAHYKLDKPGRVLLVDSDKLVGKLQQIRSSLYACWIGGKSSKWASRATIRQITNVPEQTQLNYDRQNKQRKKFTYAIDKPVEERQKPNRYYAVHYPAESSKKRNKNRHDLYTPDIINGVPSIQGQALSVQDSINGITGLTIGGKRVCFDNPNRAKAAAMRRACPGGECYAVIGESKRGSLLLRTVPYSENL